MQHRTAPIALFGRDGVMAWANAAWHARYATLDAAQLAAEVASADLGAGVAEIELAGTGSVSVELTPAGRLVSSCPARVALDDMGIALRGLVHELNNHLHVGSSVAEVLGDIAEVAVEDYVLIEDLQNACRRAVGLAEQLRAIGRAMSEPPSLISLSEALDEAALQAAGTPDPSLVVEAEGLADQLILSEPIVLQRILSNVINEAMTAAAPETTVMVTAKAADGMVQLRVDALTDGDIDDLRRRVEEPFFQSASGRSHGGSSMSVARMLARSGGGELTFNAPVPRRAQWLVQLPTPSS